MKIYIFGNGNISLGEFLKSYVTPLKNLRPSKKVSFLLCDFRGLDTLMMEYLKTESGDVSIYHIGEKPRYLPDRYKTKVDQWKFVKGFDSDDARDRAAINDCTHYLAIDKNSTDKRVSGTLKSIKLCSSLNKIKVE